MSEIPLWKRKLEQQRSRGEREEDIPLWKRTKYPTASAPKFHYEPPKEEQDLEPTFWDMLLYTLSFGFYKTEHHKKVDAAKLQRWSNDLHGLFSGVGNILEAFYGPAFRKSQETGIPFFEMLKIEKEQGELRAKIYRDLDRSINGKVETYAAVFDRQNQLLREVAEANMQPEQGSQLQRFIIDTCGDYMGRLEATNKMAVKKLQPGKFDDITGGYK